MPLLVTLEDTTQCGYLETGLYIWESTIHYTPIGERRIVIHSMMKENITFAGYAELSEGEANQKGVHHLYIPSSRIEASIQDGLYLVFENQGFHYVRGEAIIAYRQVSLTELVGIAEQKHFLR